LVILDATRVKEYLRLLSVSRADVFGAAGHRFLLNPALTEAEVSAFERRHNIHLPADYRHFLTAVGNGGAGPFYGVFPLGKIDRAGAQLDSWSEADGFMGLLSQPFPLTDSWNDLRGEPPDELAETDEHEYWTQVEQFEARYFNSSLVNGAMPICHEGCALRIWLVLTGGQAGYLWHDGRADRTGLTPLRLTDGSPVTFSGWYTEWLENALKQAGPAEDHSVSRSGHAAADPSWKA
jgi:hypothetical protein